jgi:hypothetical protein
MKRLGATVFNGGDGNGGVLQHKGDEGKVRGVFIRRKTAWRRGSPRRSGDGSGGSNFVAATTLQSPEADMRQRGREVGLTVA